MKYFLVFFISICFFSCNQKKQDQPSKTDVKPLLSVLNQYGDPEKVNPKFLKEIEEWKELKAVDFFLERFKKVSANEILSNALELEELVKSLKKEDKPALFDTNSFNARINILHNETLRLKDMTLIPAISAEEVNLQLKKIIIAFSAINTKINTVLSKKSFVDEIEIDVKYIGLDSTKMDSVSKKSINSTLKKNLEKK